MSTPKPTTRDSSSFAKNPAAWKRHFALLRYLAIVLPLRWIFALLEYASSRRSKDMVLFVCPYGELDENTRYLFHYGRAAFESAGLRPVLFVIKRPLYGRLSAQFPDAVVRAASWEGLKAFLSARLAFTSRGVLVSAFYPYYFHPRWKFFVNLWHGIPLKRINYLAKEGFEKTYRYERQPYSAITVCSKVEQITMAASFRIDLDSVWITGTPRMDFLFRNRNLPRPAARTILYAPTYRDASHNARLFPFDDFRLRELDEWLAGRNCRLIIRRHLFEKSVAENIDRSQRIVFDDRESLYASLQEELVDTDVLITDYSSIYLDYLALLRPMIFIPYDIDDYEKNRGLMFDYDKVTPGPKARTMKELLELLARELTSPDADAACRKSALDYFHEYQDGKATQRIVSMAVDRIGRTQSK